MRASGPRRWFGVAVVAVAAAGLAALAGTTPGSPSPSALPAAAGRLPPPAVPAFTPGAPRMLGARRHVSVWAPLRRATPARAAPDAGAARVGALELLTPEGTRNAVAVLDRAQDAAGRAWVRVALPLLPNGTTGWVPRRALGGYQTVRKWLDIDVDRLRATLYDRGRPILRADVAVGMPGWETPRGRFLISNKITRYRSPTYGPIAFGTSARAPAATDWPAGGFVGIHGTDRPDLVPGRVSHGCIRMRNADILALARAMPIGTPLRIH